jgi:hypothetical protein
MEKAEHRLAPKKGSAGVSAVSSRDWVPVTTPVFLKNSHYVTCQRSEREES